MKLLGHDIELVNHGSPDPLVGSFDTDVMVDGKSVDHDTQNASLELLGPYLFGDYGVVLLGEISGGNGCGEMYRALIISKSVTLTDEFGNCAEEPNIFERDDHLVVDLPAMLGGNGRNDFIIDTQGVQETDIPTHLTGPPYKPGMDLGSLVWGRHASDVFILKATAEPIWRLVGDAMYRNILPATTSVPFAAMDGYVVGFAFSNAITYQDVRFVFDHAGHVWVGTEDDNEQVTWYGDPPASAIAASDKQRNAPAN